MARAIVVTLCAVLAVGGLVVCTRRAGGTLHEPLPVVVLVGTSAVLGLAAVAFRASVLAASGRMHRATRFCLWGAASLALAFWAAGLLVPETPLGGIVGFLGLLLAEEGWSWGRMFRAGRSGDPSSESALLDLDPPKASDERTSFGGILSQGDIEDEAATQWMVRRREPTGTQTIEGWVRADIAAHGRHALAHVAICPPLDSTPQCYAEQADGPPAQVKIGQVLPYGVRFEIKLDEPADEACQVTVEFSIQERAIEEREGI